MPRPPDVGRLTGSQVAGHRDCKDNWAWDRHELGGLSIMLEAKRWEC